jgi:hypothetical protein
MATIRNVGNIDKNADVYGIFIVVTSSYTYLLTYLIVLTYSMEQSP